MLLRPLGSGCCCCYCDFFVLLYCYEYLWQHITPSPLYIYHTTTATINSTTAAVVFAVVVVVAAVLVVVTSTKNAVYTMV